MYMKSSRYCLLYFLIAACGTNREPAKEEPKAYTEQHRPQIHFSPAANWMNDPNGLVFFNNTYHLFYQYYPDSNVWGPMHWGHATSKDLAHWQHQPIALYPDSLGYIFSGSAVVDSNNTSGFGKDGQIPLIAIFTHHDTIGVNAKRIDYQHQSIAYSIDGGNTWTKYAGNPVLKNPGIIDFRDPKVSWYEAGKKWIMTLATKDRITFYASPNLKEWTKESEFGEKIGAHGGVWECPDLFPIEHNGEKIWVLLVSINPGGPNGGSATQYFTGQFDGKTFTPFQTDIRWIDYGPDDYAGVTWSNTGQRRIFLGWMSNWQYATVVPTTAWRSAMTVPRDLSLEKIGDKYFLASRPVPELSAITGSTKEFGDTINLEGPARIDLKLDTVESCEIVLSNDSNEQVIIGYDKLSNNYFIDRTKSGHIDFEKGFAARHTAPRISMTPAMDLTLIIDNASVELFADNGLTVMTEIFFPKTVYKKVQVRSSTIRDRKATYRRMFGIWTK
jgi:fructan beta-fructosidase